MGQFFEGLPSEGVWTSVGLTRDQFLFILIASTLLFVVIDGPLWSHLQTSHLTRIVWSYAAIPLLVSWALWRHGRLSLGKLIGGTVLIGVVKLLLTAVILIGLAWAIR